MNLKNGVRGVRPVRVRLSDVSYDGWNNVFSDGWTSFLKVYYIFYYLPSVWRTQVRHKKGMQRERLPLGERNDAFDMRYECQKCLCVTFAKVTKA